MSWGRSRGRPESQALASTPCISASAAARQATAGPEAPLAGALPAGGMAVEALLEGAAGVAAAGGATAAVLSARAQPGAGPAVAAMTRAVAPAAPVARAAAVARRQPW